MSNNSSSSKSPNRLPNDLTFLKKDKTLDDSLDLSEVSECSSDSSIINDFTPKMESSYYKVEIN